MPGVGAPASGHVFGTGATAGRCAGGGDGDGAGKTQGVPGGFPGHARGGGTGDVGRSRPTGCHRRPGGW